MSYISEDLLPVMVTSCSVVTEVKNWCLFTKKIVFIFKFNVKDIFCLSDWQLLSTGTESVTLGEGTRLENKNKQRKGKKICHLPDF